MASTSPQTAALFQAASDAQARGDTAGFVRALEAVLQREPGNARALNSLGNYQLNSGNPAEAVVLLHRAVEADPSAPPLWYNLSRAYRTLKDDAQELAALQKCLGADPYFLQALLAKAAIFERRGQPRIAARDYQDALACSVHFPSLNPAVKEQLAHASRFVAQQQNDLLNFLDTHLQDVAGSKSTARPARFSESLEILSGRKKYQPQNPTFYAYPSLPPLAFHDRADFPWLDTLEAETAAIRGELQSELLKSAEFVPYVAHPEGAPLNQWEELNHSKKWSAYHLCQNGQLVVDHAASCPATVAALSQAPQPRVLNNAPNAFFSHLLPRTHIPPHTGMTNTRLVVHLPLIVPEKCIFRVGNHTRVWEEGRAWVFDDTVEHEARNDSDLSRIILIFDIWNPLLSQDEQVLIAETIKAHQLFYGDEAEAMGNI
jgi:aspartate beta-hydroxylase